ncbi:hypothetical protein J3R30DRAFT_3287859 [Lentinula aciculospora]|uniref:Uncharacterized protein n=1 Tax=Lentinula aciculospora TaxID=153920 RepID=A0A9W9DQ52_9AGAR|nr:hypothetical protein J3R30DRAFT_3287859 [Lentinula aciculospora]
MDSATRRDDINLTRLIRRLENTVNAQVWDRSLSNELWLKSLETLQNVNFAKRLLKNIELDAEGSSSADSQRYDGIRANLEQFETFLKSVEKRSKPILSKPRSLLSTIPEPIADITECELSSEPEESSQNVPTLPTDSLLTSPADLPSASIVSSIPTLISPLFPTGSKSTAIASGAFLENSKARHEAMSEQLAQMAVQLKKNAQNFSEKLAEDKAIVEETQTKLDSNFGVIQKGRVRLVDQRGKSGSTTCLVIFAVVAVTITFIFMVALIRLTRR